MFILNRMYCRTFQAAFKVAIPFLPYRNPKIVPSLNDVPNVLKRKNIDAVIIITDAGIHNLGLTKPLEEKLAAKELNVVSTTARCRIRLFGMWRKHAKCIWKTTVGH